MYNEWPRQDRLAAHPTATDRDERPLGRVSTRPPSAFRASAESLGRLAARPAGRYYEENAASSRILSGAPVVGCWATRDKGCRDGSAGLACGRTRDEPEQSYDNVPCRAVFRYRAGGGRTTAHDLEAGLDRDRQRPSCVRGCRAHQWVCEDLRPDKFSV